jgi:hypothetical protein
LALVDALFGALLDAALAVTDASGADRVFFILEKMEVTKDWSFSSSSEKGLNEVKLVRSSGASLVLLRDLVLLKVVREGEDGDSIAAQTMKRIGTRYLGRTVYKNGKGCIRASHQSTCVQIRLSSLFHLLKRRSFVSAMDNPFSIVHSPQRIPAHDHPPIFWLLEDSKTCPVGAPRRVSVH